VEPRIVEMGIRRIPYANGEHSKPGSEDKLAFV
jgi:hypothetical protein